MSNQTSRESLFVVDDVPEQLKATVRTLELAGYKVFSSTTFAGTRSVLSANKVNAVLMDLQMPDVKDLELLEWIRENQPDVPILILTAYGTVDVAVRAIKAGAYHLLEKPIDRDRLLITLQNALERYRLHTENTGLLKNVQSQSEIIGSSQSISDLRSLIDRIAPTDARVLILGETGVGKELVAKAIQSRSLRASRPFIAINCTAIPKELIESELFGHRKGSFTGAIDNKDGKFKLADHGTIFLDEIGDLSPETQSKLLRVLEEGEIEPVGAGGPIKVDVRVISATNRHLEERVEQGHFRQDLYYRLKGVVVRVPPLRERKEDVLDLMGHFLQREAARHNRPVLSLTVDARARLLAHDWPGNVRELAGLATSLTVNKVDSQVTADEVEQWFGSTGSARVSVGDYEASKENFERDYFRKLLILHDGNMTAVAKAAKMDRAGLYRKLKARGVL